MRPWHHGSRPDAAGAAQAWDRRAPRRALCRVHVDVGL